MKKWMGLMMVCGLLTGCTAQQLEDRLLVVSLAVDQTEMGVLALTIQAPNAVQSSGDSAQGAAGHTLITVEGADWSALSDELEERSPHALSFTQLRQIIVSQPLAESEEFQKLICSIAGEHQVRSNAQVVITPDSGRLFLEKQKPDVGEHLGKYLDTVLKNQIHKDNVPDAALALVVRDWQDSGKDPPLMLAQINEEDKITYLGAALTSGGRVAGTLTPEETRLLALLDGGGRGVSIPLENGSRAEVTARSGARIRIGETETRVTLRVTAYIPAGENVDADAVEQALHRQLTALIDRLQKARSDAAGLRRHTLREGWRFAGASVSVTVEAQVVVGRANGRITRSAAG